MKVAKILVNTILIGAVAVLLYLGFMELHMFTSAEEENNALIEQAVKVPNNDDDPFNRYIDFEALQKINPDIVGWVYIPGTEVDYPILEGSSDEYYLNRDYKSNYSKIGSVFAYTGVSLDDDIHVCMFAHNMISKQMFGGLKNYKDREYADEHSTLYIYTPDRVKECSLISSFRCKKDDKIFELDKADEFLYSSDLLERLSQKSDVRYQDYDEQGQVFTLSTCDGKRGTSYRYTLHFMVTREKFVID